MSLSRSTTDNNFDPNIYKYIDDASDEFRIGTSLPNECYSDIEHSQKYDYLSLNEDFGSEEFSDMDGSSVIRPYRSASEYETPRKNSSVSLRKIEALRKRINRRSGLYLGPGRLSITGGLSDPELSPDQSQHRFTSMQRNKKFIIITFCIANFFTGCLFSILGPFFPTEAVRKGVNNTLVGLIFSSFEISFIIASPIFGSYISEIGGKFMYVVGVIVSGTCCVLFGFVDFCPDGAVYVAMCFIVRFFESLGASAFVTASFSIMAYNFPNNVASMFGMLELFSGLGFMVGPPIGGVLFQAGGFMLPFVLMGSVMVLVGFLSSCLLPLQNVTPLPRNYSIFSLLRIPIVVIIGLCLITGSAAIGFNDVALSIFLKNKFNLTPLYIGLVFFVYPLSYSIMSPIWGWIVDKIPKWNKLFISLGYIVGGISLFFIGPAPFIHLQSQLWLVIVSLLGAGFGISTLTITFQVILEATMNAGYADDLSTYGLISGIFNSFFSIGAFIGPLGGGYLNDRYGFEWTSVIIASITLASAILILVYIVIAFLIATHSPVDIEVEGERRPLLPPKPELPLHAELA